MAELVKMIRESDGHEADVHPDMVDDYKTGDYVVETPKPTPKPAPKKAAKAKKADD